MPEHDVEVRNDADMTRPIPVGVPFDPAQQVVGIARNTRQACFIAPTNGPPHRIDGYSFGAPIITQDPPHAGEMHPDGDELLFVVSGRIRISLELDDERRELEMGPGQAIVVPRGVWHLIHQLEPGQLVHVTPGPGGAHRPLPGAQ